MSDVYVLCSDELTGMVTDSEMRAIVKVAPTPDDAAPTRIPHADQHGGEDNVTAVVAE